MSDRATLEAFFDDLEASVEGRCAQITQMSADEADGVSDVVGERCVNVDRCANPFHIVRWATDAMDEVRR